MSNNNLAQPTNFQCGSNTLKLGTMNCTSTTIPGMSLNPIFLTHGGGSALNLTGDNVMFSSLQLSVLIDEDYENYFEFIDVLNSNVSATNGTFTDLTFDFFVMISDSHGKELFRIDLIDARFQSIGDIVLDSSSEETHMIMPIELIFDRLEYERAGKTITMPC